MIREITKKQIDVKTAQGERVVLVEAVASDDYEWRHVAGAVLMSPANVRKMAEDYLPNHGAEIVIYGESSSSFEADDVARQLQQLGYCNLYLYRGGRQEWLSEGSFQESMHYPPEPGTQIEFESGLERSGQPTSSTSNQPQFPGIRTYHRNSDVIQHGIRVKSESNWAQIARSAVAVGALYVLGRGLVRLAKKNPKRKRTIARSIRQSEPGGTDLEREALSFNSASGAE